MYFKINTIATRVAMTFQHKAIIRRIKYEGFEEGLFLLNSLKKMHCASNAIK